MVGGVQPAPYAGGRTIVAVMLGVMLAVMVRMLVTLMNEGSA